MLPPSAFKPWQEEQPFKNNLFPSSTIVDLALAAIDDLAGAAVAAENVKPKDESATRIKTGVANLCRRNFDSFFISSFI
jgi:predicted hydrolase (HD superfamily)